MQLGLLESRPPAGAQVILRPYQVQAVENLRAAVARLGAGAGRASVLLVAPTGSGKTSCAANVIQGALAKGSRVVFLAHRKELIDQCSARLDQLGVKHGVVMAGHRRWMPWHPVQVASIQTLVARPRKDWPACDLIIIDEAHHARASTYGKVLEEFPQAVVLGLTATPWRTDNKPLGDLFREAVVAASIRDLIGLGYLVKPTGFAFDTPDLSRVRVTAGDYNEKELAALMGAGKIVGNIVEQWREHARGLRTVVFAVNIEHSRRLRDEFIAAGVAAEHVDGTTPKPEREAILARVASGETQVVCNVGVLTEGWDCPRVEACVLARPTKSVTLYLQMVGRVLRPVCRSCGRDTRWISIACERCGSTDVKTAARIHDHAGCALAHGLPDAERDYSLGVSPPSDRKRRDETAEAVRMCERCFALYPPGLEACPLCGFQNPRVVRKIEEVEGVAIAFEELEKVKAFEQAPEAEKKRVYLGLLDEARERGYKPGWASFRFKSRYGAWPPRSWRASGEP